MSGFSCARNVIAHMMYIADAERIRVDLQILLQSADAQECLFVPLHSLNYLQRSCLPAVMIVNHSRSLGGRGGEEQPGLVGRTFVPRLWGTGTMRLRRISRRLQGQ